MRETLGRLGRLDCLVASAGTAGRQSFTDMSLGEWHRVLQVNLDGTFLCLREAARVLVGQEQGGSRMICCANLPGVAPGVNRLDPRRAAGRMAVALALIGNPRVAVLDEMTTGLDPQARRDTWHLIEQVRDRDVTIILVTHYMDEAERLCDRVALLDQGRIVAIDTPEGLAGRAGVDTRVRFAPSKSFDDRLLASLPEVRKVEHDGEHVIVTGTGDLANAVILTLAEAGVTAGELHLDTANLEDAFVALTGRHIHDEIGRVHR